jgi:hypothetical protein
MDTLDDLIAREPNAAEAAAKLASAMPPGLSMTVHSDQSTDDYPDLDAQPVDRAQFAKNCIAAIINAGYRLEAVVAGEPVIAGYDPNEKSYEVRSLGREVTNFRAPSQARAIELLLALSQETEHKGTELSMYEGEAERAFIYVQEGVVAYQVAS